MCAPDPTAETGLSTAEQDPRDATLTAALPVWRRRRAHLALWTVVAIIVVLGGIATWYVPTYVTAQPVGLAGDANVTGGGAAVYTDPTDPLRTDPFGNGDEAGATIWYVVKGAAGGTIRLVFGIADTGSHPVDVKGIAIPCVPATGICTAGPVRAAAPLYQGGPAYDPRQIMTAFRPFTLRPGQFVDIGWDLTMCPAAGLNVMTVAPGEDSLAGFQVFDITYSYGGWTRTVELPLGAAAAFHDANECGAPGWPDE